MTIRELCQRLHIASPRTVHWWVEEGIIPPPHGKGRAARYGREHIEAIEAWRAIQHNNASGRQVAAFCREAGISLAQYVRQREDNIRAAVKDNAFILGVG